MNCTFAHVWSLRMTSWHGKKRCSTVNGSLARQRAALVSRTKVSFTCAIPWKSSFRSWMCLEKYWINPQYFVRLNFIDDDDNDNLCTMIVALMQKDTRQRRIRGLEGEDYVQFRVFKVRPFSRFRETQLSLLWHRTPFIRDSRHA